MGSKQKVDPIQQAFFLEGQRKAIAAATAPATLAVPEIPAAATAAPAFTAIAPDPVAAVPVAAAPAPELPPVPVAPAAPVIDPSVAAAQAEAAALRVREEKRARQERISAVQSELRSSREFGVGGRTGFRSLIASQVNARRSLLGAG